MARQPFVPMNSHHLGHGPFTIPSGLDAARQKRKENQYRCGSCSKAFNAICSLHSHLQGDSYHYDQFTMTAYPISDKSCSTVPAHNKQESDDETHNKPKKRRIGKYYTESGAVIKSMLRYKTKRHKYAKYSGEKDYPIGEKENAQDIVFYGKEEAADPSNVRFEYPNIIEGEEDDLVAKTVVFENDIFGKLPTDMLLNMDREKKDKGSTIDDEPNSNTEVDLNLAQLSQSEQETVRVVKDFSEETGENNSQLNQELKDDYLIANVEPTDPPHLVNMQMTINLHSLETNEDGSLKIVVPEEDAGIFKTPQGEAILKALKAQGKGISAQNTQIIYNYTVPSDTVHSGLVPSGTAGNIGNNIAEQTCKRQISTTAQSTNMSSDRPSKIRKRKYSQKNDSDSDEEESEMADIYGDLQPVVFMNRSEKISTYEAMSILDECNLGLHDDKISKIQPINAKGGELYVIDLEALPSRRDSRHDKYLWYHFGCKKYPKRNPRVMKAMYNIKLPNKSYSDGFQKMVYEPLNPSERYGIVHYVGYETLFQPLAHGNRKHGNKKYRRTCPSVLEEIKKLSKRKELTPTMIQEKITSVAPDHSPRNIRAPRNLKQIKNFFYHVGRRKVKSLLH